MSEPSVEAVAAVEAIMDAAEEDGIFEWPYVFVHDHPADEDRADRERDQAIKLIDKAFADMRAIAAALPETVDGVKIVPGMVVWMTNGHSGIVAGYCYDEVQVEMESGVIEVRESFSLYAAKLEDA